jgi:alkylation response protein AidB-like acyl-CoA dehydrogenase
VDFQFTSEQQHLQKKCRELASDFATRTAARDRNASHPVENYDRLRKEGFLALTIGKEWGGLGASFLDHTSMAHSGSSETASAARMASESVDGRHIVAL